MTAEITLSVIVPCYNEEGTIRELLDSLYRQDYRHDRMEVVIADGMSTDRTRQEIKNFQIEHPDFPVVLIDNPERSIPAGLNRAIQAARGKYLVRLDAHASPQEGYLSRSIQALEKGQGDNVGGVCLMRPGADTWIGQSIAVAVSHPLGVGDARYRIGSDAREVDTVPFGAFRRSLIDRIGPYDEELQSNEDYEFNVRVRKSGGVVWLDPEIRSTYVAREDLGSLARQYWRYGFWKLRMLLKHPDTFRWRQLSGGFVLSWLLLGTLSIWYPLARILLLAEAVIYGTALIAAGITSAVKYRVTRLALGVPLAISVMHFSWGMGFLWSAAAAAGEKLVSGLKTIRGGGR